MLTFMLTFMSYPTVGVLLRFGLILCPARSGTLTLGRKALLRLRARLAMGR